MLNMIPLLECGTIPYNWDQHKYFPPISMLTVCSNPQACNQGLGSSVCTLYEIHSGEYSTNQEFYGMEPWMVKKAIYSLARDGKAEYIPGTTPDDSDAGVKFFS